MRTSSQSVATRPPAVAGSFYPADPDRLDAQVRNLLAQANTPAKILPKALIAPHAGYIYSGTVAAAAFAMLKGCAQLIARVVLIGPAHYVRVSGIAVPKVHTFATPLGHIPLDVDALNTITELPFVTRTDAPHAPEHALEVELPFLQTVLGPFQLVPLVVGDAAPQEVAEVLRRLWGGPETLVVASSDLSHYLDYESARTADAKTAAAIEHGDWAALGPNQACGCLAVAGLLIEAERRGLAGTRLALCNSGDTAGSRDRVVGYGAWMFAHA
jgi:AmmeMemoRadiSam system protein B